MGKISKLDRPGYRIRNGSRYPATQLGKDMADEIKFALNQQGINNREFADRIGITQSYVSDVLNGAVRASVVVLEAFALYAGVEFVMSVRQLPAPIAKENYDQV